MKRLFIITGILFVCGCKNETVVKPPEPAIIINTPSVNQHFVTGDTIHITGNITHSIPLTEVAVHMTDLSTSSEFFHNHFSAGNTTNYDFNAVYPISGNTAASFKVEVEATDKDGNSSTKELMITIN